MQIVPLNVEKPATSPAALMPRPMLERLLIVMMSIKVGPVEGGTKATVSTYAGSMLPTGKTAPTAVCALPLGAGPGSLGGSPEPSTPALPARIGHIDKAISAAAIGPAAAWNLEKRGWLVIFFMA